MSYSTVRKIFFATMTATAFALSLCSPANAGGLIGDIINSVAPGIGTKLDRWNAANGNVVDHIGAAAAEIVVPGAGQALEGYYAYNRGGIGGLVTHEMNGGTAPLPDPQDVITDQINSVIQQNLPDPEDVITGQVDSMVRQNLPTLGEVYDLVDSAIEQVLPDSSEVDDDMTNIRSDVDQDDADNDDDNE
jgi:hypothetical protein